MTAAPPVRSTSLQRLLESPVVAIPAVIVLTLAIRFALGLQWDGLDDAGYLEAAQRVSRGESLATLFPLFRTRVAMAYPLGWLLAAGWLEPSQFVLLTLTADCITVVALYAAGLALAGSLAGVSAAVLFATYPLAVQQGMTYYPTAFQVASIAAATALILWGERAEAAKRLSLSLVAGVCLGLGYLAKEDVAIVVVALAAASLIAKFPRVSTTTAFCVGAALVFAIECAMYWHSTGHPTFRLTATSGLGNQSQEHLRLGTIYHWDAYLKDLWLVPVDVGATWWLAIPALWLAVRREGRRMAGPGLAWVAATFVVVFAYLQFGSGSFTSYSPLPKSARYTAIVTPFLIVLVAVWVARCLQARPLVGAWIAGSTIAVAIPCIVFLSISTSERSRNTLAALPVLDRVSGATLYTDFYSLRLIRLLKPKLSEPQIWFHARFDQNEMVVNAVPDTAHGSFVLLDRQMAKIYTSSYEMKLPPSIDAPPADWAVIWRHRAYPERSLSRSLLERARWAAAQLPATFPLRDRIQRSVSEMIDGDDATLYRVP